MAVKLEKIVKTYYEGLEEGKLLAKKCKCCGNIEFPPVMACNTCGSTDVEWVEVSGKGTMDSVIMPGVLSLKPDMVEYMPFCLSCVTLDGCNDGVNTIVRGVTKQNREEVIKRLPARVHAEIVQRDGYKTVIFALDEE